MKKEKVVKNGRGTTGGRVSDKGIDGRGQK
jgi:hypothetical protein